MHKLLDTLKGGFDENTKLTKDGAVKVNRQSLSTFNIIYLSQICVTHNVDLDIKRSGTGLVLVFTKID